ncbi:MAG: hypothetical protein P9M14_18185 [Candidatus Alcyoniella australis]|nr:hypothetical protein [Candidatus Alcyoniella australis]
MKAKYCLWLCLIMASVLFCFVLSCDSADDDDSTLDNDDDDADDDSADDDSTDDDDDDDDDQPDAESYSGTWEGQIDIEYYNATPPKTDDLRHVIVVDPSGAFIGSLSYGEGTSGGDAPEKELTEGELRTSDNIISWEMQWTSSGSGKTYDFSFTGVIYEQDQMGGAFDSIEVGSELSYSYGIWTLSKIEESN